MQLSKSTYKQRRGLCEAKGCSKQAVAQMRRFDSNEESADQPFLLVCKNHGIELLKGAVHNE